MRKVALNRPLEVVRIVALCACGHVSAFIASVRVPG